jgi:5-(carboxyamino)imidazole ribonucleotide synthase
MKLNTKIGILGGGQLGKMLCQAASKWQIPMHVLDQSVDMPAFHVATQFTTGNFQSYEDVYQFGQDMDVITIEIEKVNTDALKALRDEGKKVFPQPEIIEMIKDKGTQKNFYKAHDFPTAPFRLYDGLAAIKHAIDEGDIGFPFVQKARRDGYDGRGVAVINSKDEMGELMDTPSVIEQKVAIKTEIAVIAARNEAGEVCTFPTVEMHFYPKANLVDYLICPANIPESIKNKADKLASRLVNQLELVGLLAIEFFIDQENNLIINEVAPRPHNSGHHTIEACITSQYEQHLRTLLNLPLGNTGLRSVSGMYNLLGAEGHSGPAKIDQAEEALGQNGVYLHWYGKRETRPFRKMGHVTVIGDKPEEVVKKINYIKNCIRVIT